MGTVPVLRIVVVAGKGLNFMLSYRPTCSQVAAGQQKYIYCQLNIVKGLTFPRVVQFPLIMLISITLMYRTKIHFEVIENCKIWKE